MGEGEEVAGFHWLEALFFGLGFGINDNSPIAPLSIFVFVHCFLSTDFGPGKGDSGRNSRKLYFPADEVRRKRNFPTFPHQSTLLLTVLHFTQFSQV